MDSLIVVPLKKPIEDGLIKPALTTLFHSTFTSDYHEINYANLIEDFANLRTEAIWGAFDKHENSLEKLYRYENNLSKIYQFIFLLVIFVRYYDQLCSLEEKLPTNKIQTTFMWKDAFDRKIISNKSKCQKLQIIYLFIPNKLETFCHLKL